MIVLDCCAAVEIAKNTERGKALQMLALDGEEVIAPTLYFYEAASYAWKATVFGGNENGLEGIVDDMLGLVDRFVGPEEYTREAYSAACRYHHSAYDLFYALLAKRTNATLFTVNGKLASLCEEMGVNVVAVIDF